MIEIKELKALAQNLHVLFVDDDKEIVSSMQSYLKKFFKEVHIAYNGAKALEIYKNHHIDLVITDINMPLMNGIEFLKEIRNFDQNKEVIIVSAFNDFHYLRDAISLGVSGYLLKPLDYVVLNQELYKSVAKITMQQENERYKNHLQELVNEQKKALEENYVATMIALVNIIESRDSYTAGHSQRVANYAKLIAQGMGYDTKTVELVYKAGLLHDIGKIGVPDSILLNPHKLNNKEYKLIQEHVKIGEEILKNIPMFRDITIIILAHHERYDGKGYPYGLHADAIPELSRILIVSDSFDAMTTSRVYKSRKSVTEALEEIKQLVYKQFHPEVVDVAVRVLKNVNVSDIIQEPRTEIEKEKFLYYFKDSVTTAFNSKYLDVMLYQNTVVHKYHYLYLLYLHNFSSYNKKYGWKAGDEFLKNLALQLIERYPDSMVFRIQGDDFVLLSSKTLELSWLQESEMFENEELYISFNKYNLENSKDLNFLKKVIYH
jgi:putative nucleotidyltransferase with HDIG domain